MPLPQGPLSAVGKIIDHRANQTGPRLYDGISPRAAQALLNPGEKPAVKKRFTPSVSQQ